MNRLVFTHVAVIGFMVLHLLQYCGNQELIDTYLAEQEALKRQKEHEDHVQSSTIRMQAWWRGIMVRRKLGPYRPEEKRKKRAVKK